MTKLEKVESFINSCTRWGYTIKDHAPSAGYSKKIKYFVYQRSSNGMQNVGTYGKLVYTAQTLNDIEQHDFTQYER